MIWKAIKDVTIQISLKNFPPNSPKQTKKQNKKSLAIPKKRKQKKRLAIAWDRVMLTCYDRRGGEREEEEEEEEEQWR